MSNDKQYSGKFLVRVPPKLHATLSKEAKEENVSLNQYCLAVIAQAIGRREGKREVYAALIDAAMHDQAERTGQTKKARKKK